MTRDEFLYMREKLMLHIETIIETHVKSKELQDTIITALCDDVCKTIDPAGLN